MSCAKFGSFPLDLGVDEPLAVRGMPRRADEALGKRIISDISDASRRYGSEIHYLEAENVGVVDLH